MRRSKRTARLPAIPLAFLLAAAGLAGAAIPAEPAGSGAIDRAPSARLDGKAGRRAGKRVGRETGRQAGDTGGQASGREAGHQGGPQEAGRVDAAEPGGWEGTPEELDEALDRWGSEYVLHIMTDRERAIYDSLETHRERLAFIDRFWQLRDPTPGTARNEYREQHFERFTTATRLFAAGKPGWATDRGRIYILLGPPSQIQRNPTGRGPMERSSEVWTYNGIDNPRLPASLDLPFVDFHGTGEFELVSDLDLTAPIVNDQFGYINDNLDVYALLRSEDTIADPSGVYGRQRSPTLVAQDYLEFLREVREIGRVPEIHLERLASLREGSVEGAVTFDSFPVQHSVAFYEAEDASTAVDVTLGLGYDRLSHTEAQTRYHYSADLYVALQRDGEVVAEDERRLNFSLAHEEWERLRGRSILQPFQLVAPPGDYELVVLARDNPSERVGREVRPLELPDLGGPGLRLSSLTLAARVERSDGEAAPRSFDKGDLRVVPNVPGVYYPDQNLMLYVQAYGLALDPAEGTNSVAIGGRIQRDGKRFREIRPVYPYRAAKDRMAMSVGVPLRQFPPGRYTAVVEVVDEVAGDSARVEAGFRVAPASEAARR